MYAISQYWVPSLLFEEVFVGINPSFNHAWRSRDVRSGNGESLFDVRIWGVAFDIVK